MDQKLMINEGGAGRGSSRVRAVTLALSIILLVLEAVGCGSSSGPIIVQAPNPPAHSNIKPGSFFTPVPPALSPNTIWHQPLSGSASIMDAGRTFRPGAGETSAPILNHYFYLVNGVMANGQPLPIGAGAPAPSSTPVVLTVNGAAPNGATNPNGGGAVEVTPLSSGGPGAQLWKAVAASTPGHFYLRSAQSFTASQANIGTFNMLIGYGAPYPYTAGGGDAQALALDLGFLSGWGTAIYINQQFSPTGDASAFQQWTYDNATGQLTNVQAGGQLYNSSEAAGVASQGPAPANQWYTYPNYFLEQVVSQPNSSPPFPAFSSNAGSGTDAAGQQAAYDYISAQVLGPGVTLGCFYEETSYTGIRCDYINLSATSILTTCAANTSSLSPPVNPGSFNGVPISGADWSAVYPQLHAECQYAADVQVMFNGFNTVLNFVFNQDSDAITPLAIDVGLSASQKLQVVPIDLVEGMVYTILNAFGGIAGGQIGIGLGILANLISTATTSVLASPRETLSQKVATTVGNLYSDLGQQFLALQQQENNGENAILEDWGRLSQIGPQSEIAGYNGLGLSSAIISDIETQAIQGYKVAVMQQLMPLAYLLDASFANLGTPTGLNTSSYNNYSYSTFGSNSENNNQSNFNNSPSLQVMQTDIFGNGADPFEVFNAINGWAPLTVNFAGGINCSIAAITLFNATANDFAVSITPSEGTIALPGTNQVSCECSWSGPELRPYGYVTLYAGANTSAEHLQDTVDISLGGARAGSLSVGGSGFCSDSASLDVSATPAAGFGFAGVQKQVPVAHNGDGGVWATIYQASTSFVMVYP
jgi:hypothetical protein